MHECTSIIINSFHFLRQNLFNKGFVVKGEGGSLESKWKRTGVGEGREGGQAYLYAHSEKNCLIFQTAKSVSANKMLGSC